MSKTIVGNCIRCKSHAFQDRIYGPGRRVFNCPGSKDSQDGPRCTVCGSRNDDLKPRKSSEKLSKNAVKKGSKAG